MKNLADGYGVSSLHKTLSGIWRLFQSSTKRKLDNCYFPKFVNFLLGCHLLAQKKSPKFAELPSLQLLMFDNKNLSSFPAFLYINSNNKTNLNR